MVAFIILFHGFSPAKKERNRAPFEDKGKERRRKRKIVREKGGETDRQADRKRETDRQK